MNEVVLELAKAYWGVHVAEDIELVKRRKHDEYQVPDHQDHAVPPVQFPTIQVRRQDQEYYRR